MFDFSTEIPQTYEQKCLCVLVLDVSGSMIVNRAIHELNRGLREFYKEVRNDPTTANRLEICMIEFSDEPRILVEPSLAENFRMPTLTTKGTTAMVAAVNQSIQVVNARKNWYKSTGQPYYRPWIILITDGTPNENEDVEELSHTIHAEVENRNFYFYALGVHDADMEVLRKISHPSQPPTFLEGIRFSSFFRWLSSSMGTITNTHNRNTIKPMIYSEDDWLKGLVME